MLSMLSELTDIGQSKRTIYMLSGSPADMYARIFEKACKDTRVEQDKWTDEVGEFLGEQSVQEELAEAKRMRQEW